MQLQRLGFKGRHRVDHYTKSGIFISTYYLNNGITNQGKGAILDTFFNALTAIPATNWVIGLIDGSGTPSLAPGDTLGSHAGWTEFATYTGNRQAWGQGTSASQAVTNSSPATFNITASGTLYGIFIASAATGTSGTLWSTAAFAAPVPVSNGDQMKVTYTLAT